MLTLNRMLRLEAALRRRGFGPTIDWSENIGVPADADAFAREAIYTVINGGLKVTVAEVIFSRCMDALAAAQSVAGSFGHPGKAKAVEELWRERERLFESYLQAEDQLAFVATLPWIGPVTSHQLLKNLGHGDRAKADRHVVRLAERENTTATKLCERLARQSGDKVATVDTILFRACAEGLINSSKYQHEGWAAAISADVTRMSRVESSSRNGVDSASNASAATT